MFTTMGRKARGVLDKDQIGFRLFYREKCASGGRRSTPGDV